MGQGEERKSVFPRKRTRKLTVDPPDPKAPNRIIYTTEEGGLIHARCKTEIHGIRTEGTGHTQTTLLWCSHCLERLTLPTVALSRLQVWHGDTRGESHPARLPWGLRTPRGEVLPPPADDVVGLLVPDIQVNNEKTPRPTRCRLCGLAHHVPPQARNK